MPYTGAEKDHVFYCVVERTSLQWSPFIGKGRGWLSWEGAGVRDERGNQFLGEEGKTFKVLKMLIILYM